MKTSERNSLELNNYFLEAIIDKFEDLLDSKGVHIPNVDREPGNTTEIYGMDFDKLMEDLRDVCRNNGITVEDNWHE